MGLNGKTEGLVLHRNRLERSSFYKCLTRFYWLFAELVDYPRGHITKLVKIFLIT